MPNRRAESLARTERVRRNRPAVLQREAKRDSGVEASRLECIADSLIWRVRAGQDLSPSGGTVSRVQKRTLSTRLRPSGCARLARAYYRTSQRHLAAANSRPAGGRTCLPRRRNLVGVSASPDTGIVERA